MLTDRDEQYLAKAGYGPEEFARVWADTENSSAGPWLIYRCRDMRSHYFSGSTDTFGQNLLASRMLDVYASPWLMLNWLAHRGDEKMVSTLLDLDDRRLREVIVIIEGGHTVASVVQTAEIAAVVTLLT